ncbi:MAG: hypothetical protein ACFFC0_09565 [Promethearchaeota archaeon]
MATEHSTMESASSYRESEVSEPWPTSSSRSSLYLSEFRRSFSLTKTALLIIFALSLIGLVFLTQSSHSQNLSENFQTFHDFSHPSPSSNRIQRYVISNSSDLVAIDEAFVSELDGRGNIGSVVTVYFHCKWASNGSDIEFGTLYVNATARSINETGWVSFPWSSPSVARVAWNVTGVDAGGITAFNQQVPPPTMIWDAIRVIVWNNGFHINVGRRADLWVTGEYLYDGLPYIGTFTLNDTVLEQNYVGRRYYTCASASNDTYNITAIAINYVTHVTWDAIDITINVGDNTLNLGETASISVSAVFDYDGLPYSGIFTLNDTNFSYNTPGKRAFTVAVATPLDSSISVINSNDVAYVTWEMVYVYDAGAWGRSPYFEPEVEFHAANVIQSELDWVFTVFFYLRYASNDLPVSDQDAIVVVNGLYAEYVPDRGRWELNVTSDGIGTIIYQIEQYRDSLGITIVSQMGLYPTINWFPTQMVLGILVIGAAGLGLAGIASFVHRTRKRVAALETALGPDRVLTLEEGRLPARTREEIVESLHWLEEVYDQIPAMDQGRLVSLEREMGNALLLLNRAINRDALLHSAEDSLSNLKLALLIRARLVHKMVAQEIASRS